MNTSSGSASANCFAIDSIWVGVGLALAGVLECGVGVGESGGVIRVEIWDVSTDELGG